MGVVPRGTNTYTRTHMYLCISAIVHLLFSSKKVVYNVKKACKSSDIQYQREIYIFHRIDYLNSSEWGVLQLNFVLSVQDTYLTSTE